MQQARCKAAFLAEMKLQQVDVLVCPGHALPAFLHGTSKDLTPSCSYNLLYNLLGFPVGSVPMSHVRRVEQVYHDARFPKDSFTSKAKQVCVGSLGMPVGVQIVARPFCDEQVLQLMRILEMMRR
jgi:fatty acid amide hydrolase